MIHNFNNFLNSYFLDIKNIATCLQTNFKRNTKTNHIHLKHGGK